MTKNSSHITLRMLKFTGWTLLGILVLGLAVRLSLKSDWATNLARTKGIGLVNQNLDATLSIGSMKGDLWKELTLTDLNLVQQDTLAHIDTLRVRYEILSLISGPFVVNEIQVSRFNSAIREKEKGVFNIQQVMKADSSEESESTFALNIEKIRMENGRIAMYSPGYLPDSTLSIRQFNSTASLETGNEISASLSTLSFNLIEGRLPEPVKVKASANYEDQKVTLEDLILETGRSLLTARGSAHLSDSSITARADAKPLALADIQPYAPADLPEDQFEVSLKIDGDTETLHLNINAGAEGFDNLEIVGDFSFHDSIVLHKAGVSGNNIDLGYFTNDSLDAYIGEFRASAEGQLPLDSIEVSDLNWGFSMQNLQYQEYSFSHLFGSGTLARQNLKANIALTEEKEAILLHPEITGLFSPLPQWNANIYAYNIDAGKWSDNPSLQSNLSFLAKLDGSGFSLSGQPWKFEITEAKKSIPGADANSRFSYLPKNSPGSALIKQLKDNSIPDSLQINGQKFSSFEFSGNITADSLNTSGFVRFEDSEVKFKAAFNNYSTDAPSYTYEVYSSDFNLNEVYTLEEFPTSLNASVKGKGRYFDPDKMWLQSDIKLDSSIVNGARLQNFAFHARLQNSILWLEEGNLNSQIVEGSFSGRKNILEQSDPDNVLDINFDLKNIQPLAALFDIDILRAKGTVKGQIGENENGILEFNGDLNLNEVNYDSLLIAEQISGDARFIYNREYINYDLNVRLKAPTIYDVTFQDMDFDTEGRNSEKLVAGDFTLVLNSRDAGQITQRGSYDILKTDFQADLTWNNIQFVTPVRTLSLDRPFHFSFSEGRVQTDTLMLSSENDSFLRLAVPYADSLNQRAWIHGENFDFGVTQQIIFGTRYIDGILKGQIEGTRRADSLNARGSLRVDNLEYMETSVDRFALNFNIQNERLSAETAITIDGIEKITGQVDIPFIPQHPDNPDNHFGNEPVSGKLSIQPIELRRFEKLLAAINITETAGIIRGSGKLSGSSREPNMEATLQLDDPTLSGIKIDSAYAFFEYDHQNIVMRSSAEIRAQGQRAASIRAEVPMNIDFRDFSVSMPDQQDSLNVQIRTEEFNLSVFNDFLNKEYVSGLKGSLNANVDITGTVGEMEPDGYLRLQKGKIDVPIAGTTLDGIRADFTFNKQGMKLNQFRANSGKGSFTATGDITLNGLQPANLSLDAKATQFKLANTSRYNLTIDLNGKLNGNPIHPRATGDITIRNGFIFLEDFGSKSVEAVSLEEENAAPFSPYDSLAMDMQVHIRENFYIRNRDYLDLEVELTGSLNAYKETGEDLSLFGSLKGEDGYAQPLGKLFKLESAEFAFSGSPENPNIFIRSSYEPSTQKRGSPITIYYVIEGTAQEPEFRFESDPAMEQQDIVCYTLFSKPCYSLESWQQVVSSGSGGATATDLLVDVLLDEIETLATRELGIDVVQIDNTRSGSGGTTSIKTGWYLNKRTFFAIVNEIGDSRPQTLFILEYMLNQNLDLIITQGESSEEGIDLRWQFDY